MTNYETALQAVTYAESSEEAALAIADLIDTTQWINIRREPQREVSVITAQGFTEGIRVPRNGKQPWHWVEFNVSCFLEDIDNGKITGDGIASAIRAAIERVRA